VLVVQKIKSSTVGIYSHANPVSGILMSVGSDEALYIASSSPGADPTGASAQASSQHFGPALDARHYVEAN